jgi:hypothetical protein
MVCVLGQGNSRYQFDIHALVLLCNISDIVYHFSRVIQLGAEGRTGIN